jgi:hypothetical protein
MKKKKFFLIFISLLGYIQSIFLNDMKMNLSQDNKIGEGPPTFARVYSGKFIVI